MFMRDQIEGIASRLKEKEEKDWAAEEVEKLIDYYRENEQLWNHNLPGLTITYLSLLVRSFQVEMTSIKSG